MACVSSIGIIKGVYRFTSQAEADAQIDEALARVMASNATNSPGMSERAIEALKRKPAGP